MRPLLALLPFALVPALLSMGRVGALASGLAGLLAALPQPIPPAAVASALMRDAAEGTRLTLLGLDFFEMN